MPLGSHSGTANLVYPAIILGADHPASLLKKVKLEGFFYIFSSEYPHLLGAASFGLFGEHFHQWSPHGARWWLDIEK